MCYVFTGSRCSWHAQDIPGSRCSGHGGLGQAGARWRYLAADPGRTHDLVQADREGHGKGYRILRAAREKGARAQQGPSNQRCYPGIDRQHDERSTQMMVCPQAKRSYGSRTSGRRLPGTPSRSSQASPAATPCPCPRPPRATHGAPRKIFFGFLWSFFKGETNETI